MPRWVIQKYQSSWPYPNTELPTGVSAVPSTTIAAMLAVVLAGWPTDAAASWPNQQRPALAPLTLSAGQQPPRYSITSQMETIGLTWPADLEPRLTQPNTQQRRIAPLTLTYGQSPPVRSPLAPPILSQIAGPWPADVGPSLTWPNGNRSPVIPPSLVVFLPSLKPPALIWDGWQPPAPMPPWPFARPVQVAPLTVTSGSQPIPSPALSVPELLSLVASWAQNWDAQTAPKNAGWNVPPVLISLPSVPLPRLIWQAWEPLWVQPPSLSTLAPLTLLYGSAPVPVASLTVADLTQIVATWALTWDAQWAAKNAAWNVPPLLTQIPFRALPLAIRAAWDESFLLPPRRVAVAPLSLTYGQSPPLRAPLLLAHSVAEAWWPTDLEPRLLGPNATRVQIGPLTLAYGVNPPPSPPIWPAILDTLLILNPAHEWAAQSAPIRVVQGLVQVFTLPNVSTGSTIRVTAIRTTAGGSEHTTVSITGATHTTTDGF